jgi:hypothetical protein
MKSTDTNTQSILDKIDNDEEYYILSHEYLLKKPQLIDNLIDYWRSEGMFKSDKIFKLALIITRNEERENAG